MKRSARIVGALGAATALVAGLTMPASAASPDSAASGAPTVVVSDLAFPLHINFGPGGALYIADASVGIIKANFRKGTREVVASDLGFTPGVDVRGNGNLLVSASGGGPEGPESQGPTSLIRVRPNGTTVPVADLLAFEVANNPDGQPQETGPEADALSNPYDVLALSGRSLVADAGGNDIVEVLNNGDLRTFTVFPAITTGECATATNNGVANGGCDPVPTDLAVGPDGYIYASGLGGETEGGNIYRINPRTGVIVETFTGFPPLTGLTVSRNGYIYAASLFANTIFRLAPNGEIRGSASVPSPTGLAFRKGEVYAASASLDGSTPGAVYKVPNAAFS